MDDYKIKIIETIVVFIVYMVVYKITNTFINNFLKNTSLQRARRKMTIRATQLFTTLTALIALSAIWGLKQNEIAVYLTSILTVLGIAFFAQWSLLSNITSSILLFFNHPLRIGDTVKILDKDYPFQGEVTDMTYFFIYIRTEVGETITIPNSLFLQKPILILDNNSLT